MWKHLLIVTFKAYPTLCDRFFNKYTGENILPEQIRKSNTALQQHKQKLRSKLSIETEMYSKLNNILQIFIFWGKNG